MASSASTVLRQELMATGENEGAWGTKNNTNLQILEAAAGCGAETISTTSGTVTLTNVDYTNDQAKKRVLRCTGALVGNLIIVVPNAVKTYIVINDTTNAFTVSIKTSSGSAIAVTQATACEVWCDGSNTMKYVTPMVVTSNGAPSSSTGVTAATVTVTPTGNLSSTNAQAAFAELQTDIDGRQATAANLTSISSLGVTKGNLILGTGTVLDALSVGANGTLLVADSAQTTGAKWAALATALGLTTRGDIVKMGASAAERLAVGAANTVLKSDGTDPSWGTVAASDSVAGMQENAIQSEMETATSTTLTVTPGRQHFHPGHPKFRAKVTVSGGTPTLQESYNVTSITDTATGRLTVTIATDFSSAHWTCFGTIEETGTGNNRSFAVENGAQAAGTVIVESRNVSNALSDPAAWHVAGIGDHA